MNILVSVVIVATTVVVAVTAMLLVRRRAPHGSYFHDGDRAAGVFGVLATGFAVLLGFVVFLAFTSYDAARSGAEAEALIVAQQVETAQLFPAPADDRLTGELVCYARSVAGVQWDRMEAGTLGEDLNPWGVEMFRTLQTVEPKTAAEQSAYDIWLTQRQDRETARNDRVHGAVGVIPVPLWLVLFFTSGLIFLYMLFFADSGERAVVQGLLMGTVVSVITAMLLLLNLLDNPFHDGPGGLEPVAMERALQGDRRGAGGLRVRRHSALRRPRKPGLGDRRDVAELLADGRPGAGLARAGPRGRRRRPGRRARPGPRAGGGAPAPDRGSADARPGRGVRDLRGLTLASEAGYLRTAEGLVSDEAAAASRLAWASTSPGIGSEPVQSALRDYLQTTRAREWDGAATRADDDATGVALARLERLVRAEAARPEIGTPASTELLASLDAVTSTRRARVAAASREIPALYVATLVAAGLALVFNAGALTSGSSRRTAVLALGLAGVVGLSLALLFSITAPWLGPMAVDGQPVDDVIQDLADGFFSG